MTAGHTDESISIAAYDRAYSDEAFTLLDVRSIDEWQQARLPGAMHLYVGELASRAAEVPGDRPVVTFCGSGQRALVAASVLMRQGLDDVSVCLGSMAACTVRGCPIES